MQNLNTGLPRVSRLRKMLKILWGSLQHYFFYSIILIACKNRRFTFLQVSFEFFLLTRCQELQRCVFSWADFSRQCPLHSPKKAANPLTLDRLTLNSRDDNCVGIGLWETVV